MGKRRKRKTITKRFAIQANAKKRMLKEISDVAVKLRSFCFLA